MNPTLENLQMLAAVCGDQTMVAIFRNCHTNEELQRQFSVYQTTIEKLTQNWKEKAGIVASVPNAASNAQPAARSMDAILQDFIDSVKCVAASLTISELSAWLNSTDDANPVYAQIKKEFKTRYNDNPEAALVYLKQKQVEILMGGNWV